jgi:nucleoside-diphosphate-sugar epimerase
MMRARRIFVAGATGVTGRQVLSRARQLQLAVLPHVRPKHASVSDLGAEAALLSLSDQQALTKELQGCTTVEDLAAALAYVASARACLGEILEGDSLWNAVRAAKA